MSMSIIQKHLEKGSKKKVVLKINDNRSTMLSVRWDPLCTKVSLHHMFLKAPKNIMQDLACYVHQEQDNISQDIREYIEGCIKELDYSHEIDQEKLITKGNIYDLKKIYHEINKSYFNSRLKLNITWFGRKNGKNRSQLTFGLYHDPLKLVKINRLLDSPSIPEYLISFVVFHEMLHHVCPSYYENGQHRVHTKEFKEREKSFEHYDLAQRWIKDNMEHLFELI